MFNLWRKHLRVEGGVRNAKINTICMLLCRAKEAVEELCVWKKGPLIKRKNKMNWKLQYKETLFALLHGRQIINFLDLFQHWGSGKSVNQVQISIAHRCTMWNVRNINDSCTKLKRLPTVKNTHFKLVHLLTNLSPDPRQRCVFWKRGSESALFASSGHCLCLALHYHLALLMRWMIGAGVAVLW